MCRKKEKSEKYPKFVKKLPFFIILVQLVAF
jgi:hypothetical protein